MTAAILLKRTGFMLVVVLAGLYVATFFGFSPFSSHQSDRDQPALLKSIQNISQFHAAVGNFEVVVDTKDDGNTWLPEFLAGRRTLFVGAGTVNAYIDLSGFAEKDLTLSEDGKSVTVHLPAPLLDKPNLDHDRSYVFTQERSVLARITDVLEVPEQAKFYKLAETKLTEAAEGSELKVRATENTKAMLTGMFGALGIQTSFVTETKK